MKCRRSSIFIIRVRTHQIILPIVRRVEFHKESLGLFIPLRYFENNANAVLKREYLGYQIIT